MKGVFYRITALALVIIWCFTLMPTKSFAVELSVSEKTAYADKFWQDIEKYEARIEKADKAVFMSYIYNRVSDMGVNNLRWDDEDTFSFKLFCGIPCIYDYDTRLTEKNVDLKNGDNAVYTYGDLNKSSGTKDVFLVGPYYGYDSSFTDYYRNLAQTIASKVGGSATVLSGTAATPAAIKARLAEKRDVVCLFDSHGQSMNGTSYLLVRSSEGITNDDFNKGWATSISGVYGIDARYMTSGQTTQLSDCFMWFATCEGMMKSGLSVPFVNCGAGGVYGYSKSVSFTGDYAYAKQFWNKMLDGYNVADSIAYMKQVCGVCDSAGIGAYPIVVSPEDPYPSNVNTNQTVHCSWTLSANSTFFITYNANGGKNEPPVQKIEANEGENTVTTNITMQVPYKFPYTFDGWGIENNGIATYQPGQEITVSESFTLYATWFISDKLNIGAQNNLSVRFANTYEYRKIQPQTDGEYTFQNSNGNVRIVLLASNGEELASGDNFSYELKSGTTYYISFTADAPQDFTLTISGEGAVPTYTLTYSAIGAGSVPVVQSGDTSYIVTNTIPTRFPYNFEGWALAENAEKADYFPGQEITLTADTTLYAVWSEPIPADKTSTKIEIEAFYGAERYIKYIPEKSGKVSFSSDIEMILYSADGGMLSQGKQTELSAEANTAYYICLKPTDNTTVAIEAEKAVIVGDCNGDGKVNTSDATVILKFAAGMQTITVQAVKAADADGNGMVNTADAVLILKYAAGIITEF